MHATDQSPPTVAGFQELVERESAFGEFGLQSLPDLAPVLRQHVGRRYSPPRMGGASSISAASSLDVGAAGVQPAGPLASPSAQRSAMKRMPKFRHHANEAGKTLPASLVPR